MNKKEEEFMRWFGDYYISSYRRIKKLCKLVTENIPKDANILDVGSGGAYAVFIERKWF